MKKKIVYVLIVVIAFILGGIGFYVVSRIADSRDEDKSHEPNTIQKTENNSNENENTSSSVNIVEDTPNTTNENNNVSNNQETINKKQTEENNNKSTSEKQSNTNTGKTNSTNSPNNIVEIEATKEYYCTNGYTLNGTTCEYKFSGDALQRYYCESGELSGTKCTGYVNAVFTAYTSGVREQCQSLYGSGKYNQCLCNKSGGTYDSNKDTCYKVKEVSSNAKLEYYCTGDLTLEGDKCVKYYSLDAFYKYTCPDGYTLYVNKCRKK